MIGSLGLISFDWMHPSWRDMVIDFLVDHKETRENFLEKAGVNGLALAISTGGGKLGHRKFPLLIEPTDWAIYTESMSRMIESATIVDTRNLLTAVLNALRIENNADTQPIVARPPLRDVAERSLTACRTKWSNSGWTILAPDLAAYYEISEFLRPLPPSPDLSESWQRHWDDARAQIEHFDPYAGELEIGDVEHWLELSDIISRYEPRFLNQIRFPASYMSFVKDFLPALGERAEWTPDFDTIDECDIETDEQESLQKLAMKTSVVFPQLADDAVAVADSAVKAQGRARLRKGILEEQAQEDMPDYLRDDDDEFENGRSAAEASEKRAKTVFLTAPPTTVLPIDQLFEDL
jgi:hypothetical protein